MMRWPAALVLENGRLFHGVGMGPRRESIGEVVFNTSLTGYQEVISEPSYAGQIVVMTASHIGNVGCNADDREAGRAVCAGLVAREFSPCVSNWRGETSLADGLVAMDVPGIDGLDTRALTHVLRAEGAMRGAITPAVTELDEVLIRVRAAPSMDGQDLVPRVTCAAPHGWTFPSWPATTAPAARHHVVVVDFGVKHAILRQLVDVACKVTVVPANTSAAAILAYQPDGVLLSNGPGDPAAVTYGVATVTALLAAGVPIFGICLGHQILALALGAKTYKLPFGHHGANHPVQDLRTGKVEITSQNHGFAVDEASLPPGVTVSHRNLFDGSVEGLSVAARPVFSVQYHPEASPGPHDAAYLFTRFVQQFSPSSALV